MSYIDSSGTIDIHAKTCWNSINIKIIIRKLKNTFKNIKILKYYFILSALSVNLILGSGAISLNNLNLLNEKN